MPVLRCSGPISLGAGRARDGPHAEPDGKRPHWARPRGGPTVLRGTDRCAFPRRRAPCVSGRGRRGRQFHCRYDCHLLLAGAGAQPGSQTRRGLRGRRAHDRRGALAGAVLRHARSGIGGERRLHHGAVRLHPMGSAHRRKGRRHQVVRRRGQRWPSYAGRRRIGLPCGSCRRGPVEKQAFAKDGERPSRSVHGETPFGARRLLWHQRPTQRPQVPAWLHRRLRAPLALHRHPSQLPPRRRLRPGRLRRPCRRRTDAGAVRSVRPAAAQDEHARHHRRNMGDAHAAGLPGHPGLFARTREHRLRLGFLHDAQLGHGDVQMVPHHCIHQPGTAQPLPVRHRHPPGVPAAPETLSSSCSSCFSPRHCFRFRHSMR